MTVELVDRWGTAGAPIRKAEEIRETFESYFASVAKYGITRQNYLICAREALPHAQRQIMETVLRSRADEAARCARAAEAAAQEARLAKEAEQRHPEDERAAAVAARSLRMPVAASPSGRTHWNWRKPRLPYMRFQPESASRGNRKRRSAMMRSRPAAGMRWK